MMIKDEQIIKLFRAFAQQEEQIFSTTAESIIQDVLAGNNHALATQLQKALGNDVSKRRSATGKTTLLPLPTDRRNGDLLISIQESAVSSEQIFLSEQTNRQIERLFEEHHQKNTLAKYGYAPKNKLLFWGKPGCGKSYCAAYVAHELGLPLGTVQLSAVISSYLGDTASHLQKIFDAAEKTPMILFLDEVDSIAKQRDDPNDVGELKRIVNSLLQAMDSFRSHSSIIIAASNHQYLLDPAVWRRFDDIVQFPLPTKMECEKYVRYLLNGIGVKGAISNAVKNLSEISFADIKRIVMETIKTALLQGQTEVTTQDIAMQARLTKNQLHGAIKPLTDKIASKNGIAERSKGCVQHDYCEWKRHKPDYSQNDYILAVTSYKKWQRRQDAVPLAVVVRIEDESRSVPIYTAIRNTIEQQTRIDGIR